MWTSHVFIYSHLLIHSLFLCLIIIKIQFQVKHTVIVSHSPKILTAIFDVSLDDNHFNNLFNRGGVYKSERKLSKCNQFVDGL